MYGTVIHPSRTICTPLTSLFANPRATEQAKTAKPSAAIANSPQDLRAWALPSTRPASPRVAMVRLLSYPVGGNLDEPPHATRSWSRSPGAPEKRSSAGENTPSIF